MLMIHADVKTLMVSKESLCGLVSIKGLAVLDVIF